MKAARNFTLGLDPDDLPDDIDSPRMSFSKGQEIPDSILDDVPDDLVLEKVARDNPEALTHDQLMVLAGLSGGLGEETEEEFDEDEFREALANFSTKGDLVAWANENLGADLQVNDGNREELEDMIVELASGETELETEPDDEDEDEE